MQISLRPFCQLPVCLCGRWAWAGAGRVRDEHLRQPTAGDRDLINDTTCFVSAFRLFVTGRVHWPWHPAAFWVGDQCSRPKGTRHHWGFPGLPLGAKVPSRPRRHALHLSTTHEATQVVWHCTTSGVSSVPRATACGTKGHPRSALVLLRLRLRHHHACLPAASGVSYRRRQRPLATGKGLRDSNRAAGCCSGGVHSKKTHVSGSKASVHCPTTLR